MREATHGQGESDVRAKVREMTKGRPISLIFFFSLPLMVGSVFQQFYMIVDSIIVGRGVGVQALASLGAADWINWMLLWAIHGFTHGFSVLVAEVFGAGDHKRLQKVIGQIVLLSLAVGVVLTVVGLLAIDPLLRLLHTEQSIIGGSRLYLQVLFVGTIIVLGYNMSAAILRCMGDSRTPLAAMVVAAVVNIGLDLLFVLQFHMGIFGAAVATVIAQLCSLLYCLAAMRQLPAFCLSREDFQPDKPMLRRLFSLGAPTALQNAVIAVGGMVVQFVLNGFGIVFVAGFTATNKLYGVLESAAIAFGYAMTAYMGQNRGAGRTDRIDAGIRSVVALSAVISVVISISTIVFGKGLLSLFVSAEEKNAAEVIEIAYHYLFIMSCLLIILFLLHAYRSSLQGLGNMRVPMASGVVELFMRIGVALLLPPLIGREGIFYAEVAAWTGAAVFLVAYYYTHIRRIKAGIEAEHEIIKE